MHHSIANMLRKGVPEIFRLNWKTVSDDYSTGFLLRMADLLPEEHPHYMLMLKLMRRQVIIEATIDDNVDIRFEALDNAMVSVMHQKYHRPYVEWVNVCEMPLTDYCETLGIAFSPKIFPNEELICVFDDLKRKYGQHAPTLADAFGPELIGDHDPVNTIGILMASAVAAKMTPYDTSRSCFVQMVFEARPQFFDEKRTQSKVVGAVNDLLENTSLYDIRDSGSLKTFIFSLYAHPNKQEKAWNLAYNLFVLLKAA